jgi:DNA-directed RNA polymerase subunit RPC12/RpoP
MKDVVRAACPGCQRSLNVPAEWMGRTVRCKHCGHAMLVRPASEAVPMASPVAVSADGPTPTWEPLPEYTPPVNGMPATAPEAPRAKYVSAFDTGDRYRGRGSYRGPRKGGLVKFAILAAVLVLVGGLGLFGASKAGFFKKGDGSTGGGEESPKPVAGNGEHTQPASGPFPRRMLAISIHSYLYANPLHNGDSGNAADDDGKTGTDAAVRRIAERWRVPKDQLYHLTDAPVLGEKKAESPKLESNATPSKKGGKDGADEVKNGRVKGGDLQPLPEPAKRLAKAMPLKQVIEGTVTQFLDTSREQDRILILFAGHALEKKGKTYLVPLEGDLDDVESLIPLDWLYVKLGACKAQEKVVIFDICRFHPERGIERPSPGPMTEALEAALHNSPDGVSVITTCSRGEQSIELDYQDARLLSDRQGVKDSTVSLRGGFFISLADYGSRTGRYSDDKHLPAPTDELPAERFAKWMKEKLADIVHVKYSDRTQTVKATIKKQADAVAYNPAEPAPARFEFPQPPPSADPRAVMTIIREVQLPPVKSLREDAPPPSISDVLPFSEETLKPYLAGDLKSTNKPNEFQKAVIDAVTGIRSMRMAGSSGELPEQFGGETSDKAKEELRKVQEVPARVEAELQDYLDDLDKVAEQRDKQPKRWQVHYDYIVAQLKLRICYANQYNLALANVRSGKLPDLQPGQNGYRLSAEPNLDKNTPANYKEMFKDAQTALTEIAKENPNTPWALLAKSDRTLALGLRLTGATVSGR